MAENETEEQQIDAIKEWWNKNGNAVIVGAVLGIGALVGWKGSVDTGRHKTRLVDIKSGHIIGRHVIGAIK